MKDVVIVGGGLAGLSAAWRLRHWDIQLLEANDRIGGRIRSERRGQYWMNLGGHVFAGPNTATDSLLHEVGVEAAALPGSLQGISMNGKFIPKGAIWSYPFRLPMDLPSRIATMKTGAKVLPQVGSYVRAAARRPGESYESRQQRLYDFQNTRSFRDFIGENPKDAEALFEVTVTRSAGNVDEISAGAGIGYFSLVLGMGEGLNRAIVGGPSTLTESIAVALGDRVTLGADVDEVVTGGGSVTVRYTQDGAHHEIEARTVILATTADVARRIGVDMPETLRGALGAIKYGSHVSSAFLTNETAPQRWDDNYAIATPKRSFAVVLNQANLVRGSEVTREPGGSIMVFSPARLGEELVSKTDEEIQEIHLRDLNEVLDPHFSDTVVERQTGKFWSPYCFPGRSKLQQTLVRGTDRIFLAGDFMGTFYTDSAIASGFTAAQRAASTLAAGR